MPRRPYPTRLIPPPSPCRVQVVGVNLLSAVFILFVYRWAALRLASLLQGSLNFGRRPVCVATAMNAQLRSLKATARRVTLGVGAFFVTCCVFIVLTSTQSLPPLQHIAALIAYVTIVGGMAALAAFVQVSLNLKSETLNEIRRSATPSAATAAPNGFSSLRMASSSDAVDAPPNSVVDMSSRRNSVADSSSRCPGAYCAGEEAHNPEGRCAAETTAGATLSAGVSSGLSPSGVDKASGLSDSRGRSRDNDLNLRAISSRPSLSRNASERRLDEVSLQDASPLIERPRCYRARD